MWFTKCCFVTCIPIGKYIYIVFEITVHIVLAVTCTSPLGMRGVAMYTTKSKYSTTMHSATLVCGSPSIAITAFSRAGSPKPSTTVTRTEKDTRSAAGITGGEAILAEWCVYFPAEARRGFASCHAPRGVTPRPLRRLASSAY